jgi:pheromone shutdown protein TraB
MEKDKAQKDKNLHVIEFGTKKIILVGTAHISKTSVDLVREVIEKENPSHICLEIDESRYKALTKKQNW